MSIKGGQVCTFNLPGGRIAPLPPVSYATKYMGLVTIVNELTLC